MINNIKTIVYHWTLGVINFTPCRALSNIANFLKMKFVMLVTISKSNNLYRFEYRMRKLESLLLPKITKVLLLIYCS